MLAEKLGLHVYLLPGKGEEEIARRVRDGARHKERVEVKPMDVRDLKVCLARASVVVGNDTGPRHVSAALSVPTVVVMGPMDERYTSYASSFTHTICNDVPCRPCNDRRCDRDHECLKGISPEAVFRKVEEVLCVDIRPELIDRFSDRRICVVGDVIADIYIYGKPHKLSREAPVVVIKYEHESICPGSAGNTINNLLALGAHVFPVGCVGRDEAGDRLFDHFSAHAKIDLGGLVRYDGRTVTKTRILAGDTHTSKQQVIRIDREMDAPFPPACRASLLQKLKEIAPAVDAVILSDYEYGLIDAR